MKGIHDAELVERVWIGRRGVPEWALCAPYADGAIDGDLGWVEA